MMERNSHTRAATGVLAFVLALVLAFMPSWTWANEMESLDMGEEKVARQGVEEKVVRQEVDAQAGVGELGVDEVPALQGENSKTDNEQRPSATFEEGERNLTPQGDDATTEMGETGHESDVIVPQASSSARITGSAHVQNIGWESGTYSADGKLCLGTTGRGLRLESMKLKVEGSGDSVPADVLCKVHVQNEGWKDWSPGGKQAGTEGKSQRLESLRIRLENAQGWHVYYRVHVQNIGWMGWTRDGELAGTAGLALRMEAMEILLVQEGQDAPQLGEAFRDEGVTATAHVQDVGWQAPVAGKSVTLGTTGRGLRVEALTLSRPSEDIDGDIVYEAHVQNIGWQGQRKNGQLAGTTGRGLRVEAIRISLTGGLNEKYDIWYRTHVGMIGWMAWTQDGLDSGTGGMSLRLEAVQVALLPKGSSAPAASGQASSVAFLDGNENALSCSYASTESGKRSGFVKDGATSGTVGQSQPVEGIAAMIEGSVPGSISYSAHVSNVGWVNEGSDGAWIGKANVEAIRMRLTGEASMYYSVWYRAHTADAGWLGWAHDGETAGSTGAGRAMEAWQVVIRSKGAGAPGSTADHEIDRAYFGGQSLGEASARQRHLVQVSLTTPSLGNGLCAAWVESVMSRAGVASANGDARDLYHRYCRSGNLDDLKVGMIVAVPSHPHTNLGSIYGHVGIYVGDNKIRHAIGMSVTEMRVRDWLMHYGATNQPRWGWFEGVALG